VLEELEAWRGVNGSGAVAFDFEGEGMDASFEEEERVWGLGGEIEEGEDVLGELGVRIVAEGAEEVGACEPCAGVDGFGEALEVVVEVLEHGGGRFGGRGEAMKEGGV
jgi:hypothetical protein